MSHDLVGDFRDAVVLEVDVGCFVNPPLSAFTTTKASTTAAVRA